MAKSTRKEILAEDPADTRADINANFQQAFFKPFGVAWLSTAASGAAADPILMTASYQTWTTIDWFNVDTDNESGVTWTGKEVMNFATVNDGGEGLDSSGIWQILSYIAWDNVKSGLQTHLRVLQGEVSLSTSPAIWIPISRNTMIFSEGAFQAGMAGPSSPAKTERWAAQSLYVQHRTLPQEAVSSYRVRAWHNATVAGSGVSLDIVKDLFIAPLHMYARFQNAE